MDKNGIYIPEEGQPLAELFQRVAGQETTLSERMDALRAEDTDATANRKLTEAEVLIYRQRQAKIEAEHQAAIKAEQRATLQQAQESNPIKPRPRKKRGRKTRA